MTRYAYMYHLCLAALLASCASIPQLDEAQPTAEQASAHPAFLSASDLRAAVGAYLQSQPAKDISQQTLLDQRAKALRRQDLRGR